MKNVERFFFPVMIFAAIVTIWVYLRGKSGGTQAIVNNPATNVPGTTTQLPGLTQVLYTPGTGGGSGGPPQSVPSIASNAVAANAPTQAAPSTSFSTAPSYLTYNFGPDFAFSKIPVADAMLMQQQAAAAGGSKSCGCGGGCSKSCVSCDASNSRYPDGRGSCLAKKVSPALVNRTAQNIQSFLVGAASIPYAANLPQVNTPA